MGLCLLTCVCFLTLITHLFYLFFSPPTQFSIVIMSGRWAASILSPACPHKTTASLSSTNSKSLVSVLECHWVAFLNVNVCCWISWCVGDIAQVFTLPTSVCRSALSGQSLLYSVLPQLSIFITKYVVYRRPLMCSYYSAFIAYLGFCFLPVPRQC